MSKFSRFSRQQSAIAGRSVRNRVIYRFPRVCQNVEVTPEVEYRLRCVQHALAVSVRAAAILFERSMATVYRWVKAYRHAGITGLRPKSRCPKRTRTHLWRAEEAAEVLRLRTMHHRCGKAKLRVLLEAEGMVLSESTIGRILASLKCRHLLIEPRIGVRSRRAKAQRPHATRVSEDKRFPSEPEALIQLDTVHIHPSAGPQRRQFTAIDVVSRYTVLGVRSQATAGMAAAFLDELVTRMPLPVQAIQVDGGSEFIAGFEEACCTRGIALYVLPPRSPKLNGRVQRMNGTCRREFWEWYDGELDLPVLQKALREYEVYYNTQRLHQALGYCTPAQALEFSYVSN